MLKLVSRVSTFFFLAQRRLSVANRTEMAEPVGSFVCEPPGTSSRRRGRHELNKDTGRAQLIGSDGPRGQNRRNVRLNHFYMEKKFSTVYKIYMFNSIQAYCGEITLLL